MTEKKLNIKGKILEFLKDEDFSYMYGFHGRTISMVFDYVLGRDTTKEPPTEYERQSMYRTIRNMKKANIIEGETNEGTDLESAIYLAGSEPIEYDETPEPEEELISVWCEWCKGEVLSRTLEEHLEEKHKINKSQYKKLFLS